MGTEVDICVTVVYSPKSREVIEKVVLLSQGSTAAQALEASGMVASCAGIELPNLTLGVWGKRVTPTHLLREGDRLEVYRPLTVDPKVARRERFVRQGPKRAAGLFAKRREGSKPGY